MGGFEATETIRKYESEMDLTRTPIVALTAHAMVGDREMCLAHQMDVSYSNQFIMMQDSFANRNTSPSL